jgi:hypothetical protein
MDEIRSDKYYQPLVHPKGFFFDCNTKSAHLQLYNPLEDDNLKSFYKSPPVLKCSIKQRLVTRKGSQIPQNRFSGRASKKFVGKKYIGKPYFYDQLKSKGSLMRTSHNASKMSQQSMISKKAKK